MNELYKRSRLLILSPVRILLEADEVSWVQIRLADEGWLGIYPGHAPLLAETLAGPLRYADDGGEHTLDVSSGILHVREGEVALCITADVNFPEGVEQAATARFDRLARSLLSGLNAQVDVEEPPHDSF